MEKETPIGIPSLVHSLVVTAISLAFYFALSSSSSSLLLLVCQPFLFTLAHAHPPYTFIQLQAGPPSLFPLTSPLSRIACDVLTYPHTMAFLCLEAKWLSFSNWVCSYPIDNQTNNKPPFF
ncbi:hypothetical protein BKA57DRAFT_472259 [Linnemannia elongata]|nr:hypothetical protein BKA57DRAFT_472259 [Linnemannia elongata]